MSETKSRSKATLLFKSAQAADFNMLARALTPIFKDAGLTMTRADAGPSGHVVFSCDTLSLRIATGRAPIPAEALAKAQRPSLATGDIDLTPPRAFHTLTVTVMGGTKSTLPEKQRLGLCYRVARTLVKLHVPQCVLWHRTGMLFTTFEFEHPSAMRPRVSPRKPRRAAEVLRDRRPDLATDVAKRRAPFEADHLEVAETHDRLDESFVQAVETGAFCEFTPAPADTQPKRENDKNAIFPHLAPEEAELRKSRSKIFSSDLIQVKEVELEAPKEPVDEMERLTAYTFNLIIMILAFPIGFGMLIYNILRGENLRVNAHALALTGVAIALDMTGVLPVLSSFV